MFSRLRRSEKSLNTSSDSYSRSSKAPSVITQSEKTPSVISGSSRQTESTVREPSIVAPSSHLYQRPTTPSEDYVNSEADTCSRDFMNFPSLAPSEFSVDAVYRRKPHHNSPDSMSTITESQESHSPSRDSGYSDQSSSIKLLER